MVSHLLASLAGGKTFAKLDLAQAYQQLSVNDATAKAQTIVTHLGVIPYFDDVLVCANDEAELASRPRAILEKFQAAGLRVKKRNVC